MYSIEYVNSLLEEIELLKMQKKELIKGGKILRNKYNDLKEYINRINNCFTQNPGNVDGMILDEINDILTEYEKEF
jgi:hypothetical protein